MTCPFFITCLQNIFAVTDDNIQKGNAMHMKWTKLAAGEYESDNARFFITKDKDCWKLHDCKRPEMVHTYPEKSMADCKTRAESIIKNEQEAGGLLWNLLRQHFGHHVEIALYGDVEDPVSITLEDMDTHEIILDAGLYTIAAREDDE